MAYRPNIDPNIAVNVLGIGFGTVLVAGTLALGQLLPPFEAPLEPKPAPMPAACVDSANSAWCVFRGEISRILEGSQQNP